VETLGRQSNRVEVAVQVIGVQRRYRQAPLPTPALPLGREHPLGSGLIGVHLELAPAPKPLGSLAQDVVYRRGVANSDYPTRPEIEPEERAVLAAPALGGEMKLAGANLQRVTQTGKRARAGEVIDRPERSRARSCVGFPTASRIASELLTSREHRRT
jgi:hypothetical protein